MKIQSENLPEIIRQLSANDSQSALKSLYIIYFDPLIRFVTLYVGSIVVAEEIVSDTFLAVWNNRHFLINISNFTSYIYKIAKYKSVDYLRTRYVEPINLGDISMDLFSCTETTPEKELISKESIQRLNRVIDQLPTNHKLAFKLIREDKMKYKEVASILDVSVKTIEAYMTSTIKTLMDAMRKEIQSE